MSVPTIYLGLPDLRPDYVQAARDLGAPVMLSANALAKPWTAAMRDGLDQPHPGFRPPPKGRLDGVRCALDSMGYTAMRRFGGYPVTPEQYFDLAAAHPWELWSSQDLCCEPEVAGDEEEIVARIMETAHRYDLLAAMAWLRGIAPPLKVLQGWGWWHYAISAEALEISEADTLVGVGSVCRRHRGGPDGVMTIIDRLDRELPKRTKLHLFGVTSSVLSELAAHPRIASMDSQAWGAALRREHPTGRTNALAIECMAAFYRAQQAHIRRGGRGFPRTEDMGLRTPPIWKNRTPAYRRAAAEVLHAIRNGDLDAADYGTRMQMFAWAEEEGALPAPVQDAGLDQGQGRTYVCGPTKH